MNKNILNWLNENVGNMFESPRRKYNPKVYPIKIIHVDEEKEILRIGFVGGSKCPALRFWMFERALDYIRSKKNKIVKLGTKVAPPYDEDTIEGQIWREPFIKPPKSPFKASPHVCDILVLVGLSIYEKTKNLKGRSVQGIKYTESPHGKTEKLEKPSIKISEKQKFAEKYKETIINWIENRKEMLANARFKYSWQNRPTLECVEERNNVSKAIIMARIRNHGGIDLDTLDKVTLWGFNKEFPLRKNEEVIKITQEAFSYLDKRNLVEATKILLKIFGVGISRTSKILGLFDQENLCIYDSRVSNALKDLKYQDKKIILCPAGRNRSGDNVANKYVWAEQYQRLIWTVEIIRDYLNERRNTFRLADVEMALFMIGK